jgi:hypothetical protein
VAEVGADLDRDVAAAQLDLDGLAPLEDENAVLGFECLLVVCGYAPLLMLEPARCPWKAGCDM